MASTMADAAARPVALPTLNILDVFDAKLIFKPPVKRINDGPDVNRFLTSLAYRDIGTFVFQLNHALCPRNQTSSSLPQTFVLSSTPSSTRSVLSLLGLLSHAEGLIQETPPDPGPRRFGNVSFRRWIELLEQRAGELLKEGLLGETLAIGNGSARTEVQHYLLGAFGSAQRLDYGTGHELSFMAFLGALWKLGHFKDGTQGGDIEREIVLKVVERYMEVVRKLILTYTLEPAGSHGVWGLDDHSFMPYIFGSAQLTRPIDDADPMPLEGSVRGAPKPADVTKAAVVEDQRQVNMYFSAIGFINDVKKGPFWEHSPILFDISGIRDGWGKINKGMIKMFNAEVLSKFPVVQHFPFGSLFSWDQDPNAQTLPQSVHMINKPVASAAAGASIGPGGAGTAAPWARATVMPSPSGPGVPYSRIPPPPGPRTGSLTSRPPPSGTSYSGSTRGQITVTKAPWAEDL